MIFVLVEDLKDVVTKLVRNDAAATVCTKKSSSWQKRKEENEKLWVAHRQKIMAAILKSYVVGPQPRCHYCDNRALVE